MRYCFVLAILLSGCVAGFGDTDSSVEGQELAEGCKIEGSQIGREGVVLTHKSRTVTFRNWIGKTGSQGEYVGFTLELGGTSSISYNVKASTNVYPATATTWISPYGTGGGSTSPGISNVALCDCDCPCGEGTGGDGGGDDGTDGGGGTTGGDPPPIL
jgi:hypothetical protein